MRRKRQHNIIDAVPRRKNNIIWTEKANGCVTVELEHCGFYAKLAQRFFHKPHRSTIALDVHGSYVWKQMDGTRNVREIACGMKQTFGAQAEPLYARLISFVGILLQNGLAEIRK